MLALTRNHRNDSLDTKVTKRPANRGYLNKLSVMDRDYLSDKQNFNLLLLLLIKPFNCPLKHACFKRCATAVTF